MNLRFNRTTSLCLIIGSVMLVTTMVLHPAGGSAKEILHIYNLAVGTHSLAIFSLPFLVFGFWGLTDTLLSPSKLSILGFIVICFSFVAGMIAATMNGLVLPFFVKKNINDFEQNEQILKPIIDYGLKINLAMDYILIVGLLTAISIYSFLILKYHKKLNWIGYLGFALLPIAFLATFLNFNFTSISGFRLFVFAIVIWIISVGNALYYSKFETK
jgi:hypothetical protein